MLTDILLIACPILIISGIVLKTKYRKNYAKIGTYLIVGGVACLAMSLTIGWDEVVSGFKAGYAAEQAAG